jgi:hypothetical protein
MKDLGSHVGYALDALSLLLCLGQSNEKEVLASMDKLFQATAPE